MAKEDTDYNRIRVILPSVTSFEVEYESLEDLKKKVCERLAIEPELTNLIFVDRDEDLEPMDPKDHEQQADEDKPKQDVIVDYLWSRQMISLGDKQKILRRADALIVGAGALGNEIVKNLAFLGFGKITVVDFDSVEYSNVSRGMFEFSDIGKNKAEVLAKRMGELQAEAYKIEYGWKDIAIVRPANVYGPYVQKIPTNLFNDLDTIEEEAGSVGVGGGNCGWHFNTITGAWHADTDAHTSL